MGGSYQVALVFLRKLQNLKAKKKDFAFLFIFMLQEEKPIAFQYLAGKMHARFRATAQIYYIYEDLYSAKLQYALSA